MLPTRRKRLSMVASALCGVMALACSTEGRIDIELIWPDVPELSPVQAEISEVTLVQRTLDMPTTRTVYEVTEPGADIEMGRIEASDGLKLAVELRSQNQRLIGYGRSETAVDVSPGDSLTVPIYMRRPLVYVAGDRRLGVLDSTRDPGKADALTSLSATNQPRAATISPNGATLLVAQSAGAGAFHLLGLSTSNHTDVALDVPLIQEPSDLAVASTGRYVLIAHAGVSGGVSVVDTESQGIPVFIRLGSVSRVAIAPQSQGSDVERGFALVDRSMDCTGGGPSRIAVVDLQSPDDTGAIVDLGEPIQDIAASRDSPELFAANRCDDAVQQVLFGDDIRTIDIAEVPDATTVVALDERIWAVGSLPPNSNEGARLVAVSMERTGADQVRIELPTLQENAKTLDFSGQGDEAGRSIDADAITALHLAVLPGGDSLAVITHGTFHAPQRGEVEILGIPFPILPEIEMESHEYLFVDIATASVVQRVRSVCELEVKSLDALVTDWVCTQSPGQTVTDEPYIPSGLSALFGAN